MCDPATLGSMALVAAGTAYAGHEQNQTQNNMIAARNAATQTELARNRDYQNETKTQFGDTMSLFAPAAQEQRLTGEQNRIADVFGRNAPTNVGSLTTTGAPRVVGESENKKIADVFAGGEQRNFNLAKVMGYDQSWLGNKVDVANAGRNVDMVGDFAKVSAGISKTEQEAAYRNAFKPSSGIGELMQFAGNTGAFRGGQGKPLFGAPGAAAPQVLGMPLNIMPPGAMVPPPAPGIPPGITNRWLPY